MSRFRNQLFVVVVMAVWLFATQHCGLEAAGVFAAHDGPVESGNCCPATGGCENDGCATVEEGAYRADQRSLVVSAPSLAAETIAAYWVSALVPPRESERVVTRVPFERPLDWVPTWQFVQRAALSPRAPSLG